MEAPEILRPPRARVFVAPNVVQPDVSAVADMEAALGEALVWAAFEGREKDVRTVLRRSPAAARHVSVAPGAYTALHAAALAGHKKLVVLLIERGALVNSTAADGGRTPLILAALRGHHKCVCALLDAGAEYATCDAHGATALHAAAAQGDRATLQTLIDRGCDVRAVDQDGNTALHVAACVGHMGAVALLVAGDGGATVAAQNTWGATPLHMACADGRTVVVACLLQHGGGARPSQPCPSTAVALALDHIDCLQLLLDAGVSATAKSPASQSDALYLACVHDKQEAARQLLSHRGTSLALNTRNHGGNTALHALAWRGRLPLVQTLFDYERSSEPLNVNILNAFGGTPLFVACAYGHAPVVARLLRVTQVVLDAQSCDGATALYMAAWRGYADITQSLVDAGADTELRFSSGNTALHAACYHGSRREFLCRVGHVECARALISAGARVDDALLQLFFCLAHNADAANNKEYTPLHVAVYQSNEALVRMLIDAGASVKALTNNGRTPVQCARTRSMREFFATPAEKRNNSATNSNATTTTISTSITANVKDGKARRHWRPPPPPPSSSGGGRAMTTRSGDGATDVLRVTHVSATAPFAPVPAVTRVTAVPPSPASERGAPPLPPRARAATIDATEDDGTGTATLRDTDSMEPGRQSARSRVTSTEMDRTRVASDDDDDWEGGRRPATGAMAPKRLQTGANATSSPPRRARVLSIDDDGDYTVEVADTPARHDSRMADLRARKSRLAAADEDDYTHEVPDSPAVARPARNASPGLVPPKAHKALNKKSPRTMMEAAFMNNRSRQATGVTPTASPSASPRLGSSAIKASVQKASFVDEDSERDIDDDDESKGKSELEN